MEVLRIESIDWHAEFRRGSSSGGSSRTVRSYSDPVQRSPDISSSDELGSSPTDESKLSPTLRAATPEPVDVTTRKTLLLREQALSQLFEVLPFRKPFLTNYRRHYTPQEIFRHVVEHMSSHNCITTPCPSPLCSRRVLVEWFRLFPKDFSEDMLTTVSRLEIFIERQPSQSFVDLSPFLKPDKDIHILELSPTDIARQLVFEQSRAFSAITQFELTDQRWTAETKLTECPNVMSMINNFNHLSKWVALEILERRSTKNRHLTFAHMIKIADECLKLHDYHAVFSIVAGLHLQAIYRLKLSEELSPELAVMLQGLTIFTSSGGNHMAYRPQLSMCIKAGIPCVPHLAVLLKDMFLLQERTLAELRTQRIDVLRWRKVSDLLDEFTAVQNKPYQDLKENTALQQYMRWSLHRSSSRTVDYLQQRSFKIEPRVGSEEMHRRQAIDVLLQEGFL